MQKSSKEHSWSSILFYWFIVFIYISNVIPLPSSPPQAPYVLLPPPALYESVPPPTHPFLPQHPSVPLSWVIKPQQNKEGPFPVMLNRQSSDTYRAGAIGIPFVLFGW